MKNFNNYILEKLKLNKDSKMLNTEWIYILSYDDTNDIVEFYSENDIIDAINNDIKRFISFDDNIFFYKVKQNIVNSFKYYLNKYLKHKDNKHVLFEYSEFCFDHDGKELFEFVYNIKTKHIVQTKY